MPLLAVSYFFEEDIYCIPSDWDHAAGTKIVLPLMVLPARVVTTQRGRHLLEPMGIVAGISRAMDTPYTFQRDVGCGMKQVRFRALDTWQPRVSTLLLSRGRLTATHTMRRGEAQKLQHAFIQATKIM